MLRRLHCVQLTSAATVSSSSWRHAAAIVATVGMRRVEKESPASCTKFGGEAIEAVESCDSTCSDRWSLYPA